MSHYPGDGGKGDRSGGRHRRRGGRTLALPADVIKESGLRTLFDEAVRPFGPADILVDNAGVHAFGPLEETAEDGFRHQLDTESSCSSPPRRPSEGQVQVQIHAGGVNPLEDPDRPGPRPRAATGRAGHGSNRPGGGNGSGSAGLRPPGGRGVRPDPAASATCRERSHSSPRSTPACRPTGPPCRRNGTA
ncbi:SDR family oxidoreductase [Streptomyces sp. NPDC006147]|uniref:SDR family NAD(P)-dependent oxidoreductase n=1 Tax=Streptomyces sp. NPDC006147 TaxID=3155597 RepID=UPI0033AD3BEC